MFEWKVSLPKGPPDKLPVRATGDTLRYPKSIPSLFIVVKHTSTRFSYWVAHYRDPLSFPCRKTFIVADLVTKSAVCFHPLSSRFIFTDASIAHPTFKLRLTFVKVFCELRPPQEVLLLFGSFLLCNYSGNDTPSRLSFWTCDEERQSDNFLVWRQLSGQLSTVVSRYDLSLCDFIGETRLILHSLFAHTDIWVAMRNCHRSFGLFSSFQALPAQTACDLLLPRQFSRVAFLHSGLIYVSEPLFEGETRAFTGVKVAGHATKDACPAGGPAGLGVDCRILPLHLRGDFSCHVTWCAGRGVFARCQVSRSIQDVINNLAVALRQTPVGHLDICRVVFFLYVDKIGDTFDKTALRNVASERCPCAVWVLVSVTTERKNDTQ